MYQGLLVYITFIGIGFGYLNILFYTHPNFLFYRTATAYYNDLITAFFHGRLFLEGQASTHDLSFFEGKWYPYWGPSPVLFVLPFYAIFGSQVSDFFYTLIGALLGVIIFYSIIKQFIYYFNFQLTIYQIIAVLLGYAFVSPLYFVAVAGGIWHTNQIIALLYLLIFYLYLLKFINKKNYKHLLIAVLFFNLAWSARYIMIINGILFLVILHIKTSHKTILLKKSALIIGSITMVFILLFLLYNFARFHNPLELGHRFQKPDVKEAWNQYSAERMLRYGYLQSQGKSMGFEYIPDNFEQYFMRHAYLSSKKPFIKMDKEGNSILSSFPLLIFIIGIFNIELFRNRKSRLFILLIGSIVILHLIWMLMYVTTSSPWEPFGNRYILDIIPILYLLVLWGIERIRSHVFLYIVLIYGIVLNILGIFNYNFFNNL